jgi:two-component system, NtrC family, sensor histidine kinase HydH
MTAHPGDHRRDAFPVGKPGADAAWHVFDPGDGAEEGAGGPARRRDITALPIFDVFEKLGRGCMLAGVLAPAHRLAPVLLVGIVGGRIERRMRRRSRRVVPLRCLRRRRALSLGLHAVLRGAHVVGADSSWLAQPAKTSISVVKAKIANRIRAQNCNRCSHHDFPRWRRGKRANLAASALASRFCAVRPTCQSVGRAMTTNLTFFENIKLYVGFTDASSAALRELHPVAEPFFVPIVDDFYAAIEAHPGAREAITGGTAQIERLKQALIRWMDKMLLGAHDEGYYELRARIGRMHVRIALPQAYMFTAMDRIRVRLLDVLRTKIVGDANKVERIATALNQIMDLELAIMLETYREDLETKHRNAERLATIGQFAASIGHELRNPLGVVESSLYLVRQHLGEQVAAQPQVAKHLDRIGSEVQRANRTIHDLLDLARNRPPRRHRTDLRALVESAADAALVPAAITLEIGIPADLTANIDPDQVRQILTNLLTNAAQALRKHSHI